MNQKILADDQLIQYIKGQKTAFQNIAIRHLLNDKKIKGSTFNFVNQYRLQQQDGEDILQEAIIIFIKSIEKNTFHGNSKISTFIIGIVKKLCQTKVRQNKGTLYLESEKIQPDALVQSKEAEITKMESQKEFRTVKRKLFQELSEKCKRVLTLAASGHSREEIAEAMNWSNVQTAKNSVPDCRKRLRRIIESNPKYLNVVKQNL